MELIQFTPTSLKRQNILNYGLCALELHEKYVKYSINFTCTEPVEDGDMPWQEREECCTVCIKRELLGKVELYYIQESDVWKLELEASCIGPTLNLYYKNKNKAETYFAVLLNYLFDGDPH